MHSERDWFLAGVAVTIVAITLLAGVAARAYDLGYSAGKEAVLHNTERTAK